VIDAAQESPVSCHGSRGFPFEFADGPFFERRLPLASVPRRQIIYAKFKTFMGESRKKDQARENYKRVFASAPSASSAFCAYGQMQ
jgi:hypothetical protein